MEKSLWDKTGDVGGLDGLMRSVPQLGCPEKKKRKASGQSLPYTEGTRETVNNGAPIHPPPIDNNKEGYDLQMQYSEKEDPDCPVQNHCTEEGSSLPPQSEFAPPTNTSSDHLIASNPFDDDYSILPISDYTYFGKLGYSNIERFNTFRMPPNTSPKRPSRNVGNQMLRDQPPPFTKDLRVMGKSFPFNLGAQEKSSFESESFFYSGLGQTITMPGQHFRANQNDEDLHRMMSLNSAQRNDFQLASYRPQGVKMNVLQIDSNSSFNPAQPHFMPSRIPGSNQGSVLVSNNNLRSAGLHDKLNLDIPSHPISSPNNIRDPENFQADVVDLSDCVQINGMRNRPALSRLAKTDVTPSEKCNRWLLHSDFCGTLSTDNLHPCGICSVEVNVADAIMCEASCRKWFHTTCTGMTEMAYALLRAEPSAIWGCDSCMSKKDIQLVRTKK